MAKSFFYQTSHRTKCPHHVQLRWCHLDHCQAGPSERSGRELARYPCRGPPVRFLLPNRNLFNGHLLLRKRITCVSHSSERRSRKPGTLLSTRRRERVEEEERREGCASCNSLAQRSHSMGKLTHGKQVIPRWTGEDGMRAIVDLVVRDKILLILHHLCLSCGLSVRGWQR